MSRKMLVKSSPNLIITHDEEKWKIETKSLMNSQTIEFKIGEEFDDALPSGGAKFKVYHLI